MNKITIFIVLICTVLVYSGIQLTNSFFTVQKTKTGNILSTAVNFSDTTPSSTETDTPPPTPTNTPTPTPTPTDSPTPTPITDHLVINEVYYNNDSSHGIGGTNSNPKSEWVELYNPTDQAIGISGWSISDTISCDSISTTSVISAYGFAIITPATETEFFGIWPSVPSNTQFIKNFDSEIGSGLNDGGDRVILRSVGCGSSDSVVDAMSYGSDTTYFSLTPVHKGDSWERNLAGKDTDTASDWIDQTSPSPGS